MTASSEVPFKFHPRVFQALGSDLVTSDIIAMIELVKNSYDAGATEVIVGFEGKQPGQVQALTVADNGSGMSRSTLVDVWCTAATPYRLEHQTTSMPARVRRTSGAKGLGRLSAARLGDSLELTTKTSDGSWKLSVNWPQLSQAADIASCTVRVEPAAPSSVPTRTGTLIRITEVKDGWNSERIQELRDQLSRLVSPFHEEDYKILLAIPGGDVRQPVSIEPPEFLDKPTYSLRGKVNHAGVIEARYEYRTLDGKPRSAKIERSIWGEENEDGSDRSPLAGPFSFEIRAWDADAESMKGLASRFSSTPSRVRAAIKQFRGVSLYRDGILVLPKSDENRDWMGLDLRRVSKVGTRMSTSQIVGYVSITALDNPRIIDTSDRERLVQNRPSLDLKLLLQNVVKVLEDERDRDRDKDKSQSQPFQDLFGALSPEPALASVRAAAGRGDSASAVLPVLEQYAEETTETIRRIERRLIQYSGLASLGTIAAFLTHEIRNHSVTLGRLVRKLEEMLALDVPIATRLRDLIARSARAIAALLRLVDVFAPLATTSGRRKGKVSVEEMIRETVELRHARFRAKDVTYEVVGGPATVAIHPGELATIILNLTDNALYWLASVKDRARRIRFVITPLPETERVRIQIDDSGPGVRPEDEERIFWPGVTQRSEGLGMGLTVASELVSQHGGRMTLVTPGYLEGATFVFDLPCAS